MSLSKKIIPKKIKNDAHLRVIAPSRSMKILTDLCKNEAIKKMNDFGFSLTYGKHVDEVNDFNSTSIESRINDLHEAFSDKDVDAIFTVIGGYNSNQLLQYIDYKLIAENPKIFCGFSDITILANAILAKTGMITYLGPHFSSWGMLRGFEYSQEYFSKCCMQEDQYNVSPSKYWSDDPWYLDQQNREFYPNDGYWVLTPGKASGRIIGGNASCLNTLQGTEYWPRLNSSILLLEDFGEINPAEFDQELQSIIHQPDFKKVKGVLIGRFQKKTQMTKDLLNQIIQTKKELQNIPVIGNFDIGHTTPLVTMPIGGNLEISATNKEVIIKIIKH